jgi:hypothetical protein
VGNAHVVVGRRPVTGRPPYIRAATRSSSRKRSRREGATARARVRGGRARRSRRPRSAIPRSCTSRAGTSRSCTRCSAFGSPDLFFYSASTGDVAGDGESRTSRGEKRPHGGWIPVWNTLVQRGGADGAARASPEVSELRSPRPRLNPARARRDRPGRGRLRSVRAVAGWACGTSSAPPPPLGADGGRQFLLPGMPARDRGQDLPERQVDAPPVR